MLLLGSPPPLRPHRKERTEMDENQLCDTTETPRASTTLCQACETYENNLGPCKEFEMGMNGRCVYCDHDMRCHLFWPQKTGKAAPKGEN